jgi:HSP20 family protein
MSLIRWRRRPAGVSPFEMMERLFGELGERMVLPWGEEGEYGPPVDVYETEDEIVVKAQLPGVKREEVEVTVQENTVTLRAETKREEEVEEEGYFRRELRYGTFARSIPLPADIDEEQVTAKMTEGVLEVHAKKSEKPEAGGRKVAVE